MSSRRDFLKGVGGLFAGVAAWSLPKTKGVEAAPPLHGIECEKYGEEQAPLILAECQTPVKRRLPFQDLPPLSTMRMDQIAAAAQVPMRVELGGPCNEPGYWSPFEHLVFPWKIGEKMSFDDFQLEIKPANMVMRGSPEASIMPNLGHVPVISVEGNEDTDVIVPIYPIGCAVDWQQKYMRENRWDVIGRGLEVFNQSFVRKIFCDQWHTILASGVHRNILVYDKDAKEGLFTNRLSSICKTVAKRHGTHRITDVVIGTDAWDDAFGGDERAADVTAMSSNLPVHDMMDLDPGHELYNFYVNELGGSFPPGKKHLAIYLDCTKVSSFLTLIPENKQLEVYNDDRDHESMKGRKGLYGNMSLGVICTRPDTVLIGAF